MTDRTNPIVKTVLPHDAKINTSLMSMKLTLIIPSRSHTGWIIIQLKVPFNGSKFSVSGPNILRYVDKRNTVECSNFILKVAPVCLGAQITNYTTLTTILTPEIGLFWGRSHKPQSYVQDTVVFLGYEMWNLGGPNFAHSYVFQCNHKWGLLLVSGRQ